MHALHVVGPHMPSLQRLEKTFKRLDLSWKVIETTARVVCPPESAGFIATLEHTRAAFSRLAKEMLAQLADTHLHNAQRDLAARAQVAIDILVRNLFERTADVGFIATDAPLVAFTMAPSAAGAAALHARLKEYQAKYTVYNDMLVLDTRAQVLLSLQPRPPQKPDQALPQWWSQAMGQSGFVETFGASTLFEHEGRVLLYAHRIESAPGVACGVVVLRFDLTSEVDSIFKALADPNGPLSLLLLDEHQRVVASNAPALWSSMDKPNLPATRTDAPALLRHQGRDHLVAHCHTRGYQGFHGPRWTAVAMVTLSDAFGGPVVEVAQASSESGVDMAADNPQLQATIARARAIEEDLNRVIWNGKLTDAVTQVASSLHPVFDEIGRTSKQTIAVFDSAIVELRQLLMSDRQAELATHAALAVNIMDRNLYERANDCRWWALSEELASLLATLNAGPDASATARAGEILAHLNSLYTVYRRVALFGRQGQVLAVSCDANTLPPGLQLPAPLVQRTLALRGTQAYTVSGMVATPLADGKASYVYCAPIRQPGSDHVLGGMALAFNCADELDAMLADAMPADDTTQGLLLDPAGRVLASTDASVAVGDMADFVVTLTPGAVNQTVGWQGRQWLAGVAKSSGYREFKVSDGYRDDVTAVLLTPARQRQAATQAALLPHTQAHTGSAVAQYGVVQCGQMLFGLHSAHVVEAVSAQRLTAGPVQSQAMGMLSHTSGGQTRVLPVLDACQLTGQPPLAEPTQAVAVVVRSRGRHVAILVDRLVDVIGCAVLLPPPGGVHPDAPWMTGLIHDANPEHVPVFTLDPDALVWREPSALPD